jgi:hypothetical protein
VPIVPALIAVAGERASRRFLEFFATNIRNPHTRRAYSRVVADFMSTRTTQLYDRRREELNLDEVKRIRVRGPEACSVRYPTLLRRTTVRAAIPANSTAIEDGSGTVLNNSSALFKTSTDVGLPATFRFMLKLPVSG